MAVKLNQNPNFAPNEPQKVTFEEFLQCESEGVQEWIDGKVEQLSPISDRHQEITEFVFSVLSLYTRKTKCGRIFCEPYVMRPATNGNGRSPDILFVRNEHKDRIKKMYLDGPADIVVEVVSTSSVKTDYIIKRDEYERAGIPEYWISDPIASGTSFLVLGEDGIYHESELDQSGRYVSAALSGMTFDPTWFHQETLPLALDILKDWGLL